MIVWYSSSSSIRLQSNGSPPAVLRQVDRSRAPCYKSKSWREQSLGGPVFASVAGCSDGRPSLLSRIGLHTPRDRGHGWFPTGNLPSPRAQSSVQVSEFPEDSKASRKPAVQDDDHSPE